MGWKEFASKLFGDVLDLAASVVGSVLSWPVAFVVAIAVFYRPIRGLIGRVKSGKFPGFEFNVAEELAEAEAAASNAEVSSTSKLEADPPAENEETGADQADDSRAAMEARAARSIALSEEVARFAFPYDKYPWRRSLDSSSYRAEFEDKLAEIIREKVGPLELLRRSYVQLEKAIEDLYMQATGDQSKKHTTANRQAIELFLMGVVDEAFLESFQRLQRIHRRVLHDETDFSSSEAQAFGKTATRLRGILESQMHES